ncbi:hypothetical protein LWI29_003293 [Acer saccharum]|uniref:Uncharacterized protein n=1 Tax=Acer saccharum TaxID=4024 RepID=A0AA39SQV0_ACESA|nr:hypothetical protein LWI29_003293 [Acer saccharum]
MMASPPHLIDHLDCLLDAEKVVSGLEAQDPSFTTSPIDSPINSPVVSAGAGTFPATTVSSTLAEFSSTNLDIGNREKVQDVEQMENAPDPPSSSSSSSNDEYSPPQGTRSM